jgi:hypothetical protein
MVLLGILIVNISFSAKRRIVAILFETILGFFPPAGGKR